MYVEAALGTEGCIRVRYRPAGAATAGRRGSWVYPEIITAIAHMRDVLGDEVYESLAQADETMTSAAMATYAFNQIDQARAELNAVSK